MTEVYVPWENRSNILWNETCAKIIEHFGLPGGKYQTEISADFMRFNFVNERDALICKILISEHL